MGKFSILLLICYFLFITTSHALNACVENAYSIPQAKYVENQFKKLWIEEGNKIDCSDYKVKVLIGTPAIAKELLAEGNYKRVYTFVIFPEEFNLTKRKNFFGVRIFPLPERTYLRFIRKLHLEKHKVAVLVSKDLKNIAKIYLPKRIFKVIVFDKYPLEKLEEIKKYKYLYIFPDPYVLKVTNLITIINFAKQNNIKVFSGIFDLKKFGLTYVDEVNFDKLAEELFLLSKGEIKEKLLPCPCK